MITGTMAVTAASSGVSLRAEYARDARMLRFAALVVDSVLLGAITFVVNSVYGITQPSQGITLGAGPYATIVAWPWLTLVGLAYFTVPEALSGATPGKAWARLRVVRLDGRPLGLKAVLVRNLLKPVDFLPLLYLLGGVLVLATQGSQRLGDLAAGTTVVYRHRALEPGATRSSGQAARRLLVAFVLFAVAFTMAFDYFGRPPLVIAGLYNAQWMPMNGVTSYQLGPASWQWGEVTYPITLVSTQGATGPANSSPVMNCSGSITLDWGWIGGWNESQAGWSCGSA